MKREDFIAASTSTRIYEDDLLSYRDLERLNEYDSLSEVLNSLNDSSYARFIGDLNRDEEYEIILNKELKRVYGKISEISPDDNLINYLKEKYNFHNLKVLVKEIIQDKDYKHIYQDMGNIDIDYIKRELLKTTEETFNFVIDQDEKSKDIDIYIDYAKKALKAYEESKDPAMIDISLDKSYYERLIDLAYATEIESLVKYTKEEIDLINIKSLLRVKSQNSDIKRLEDVLILGGNIEKSDIIEMFNLDYQAILAKTSNYDIYPYLNKAFEADKEDRQRQLDLEKAIDNHFMDFAKLAKQMTYGPEVLLSYLISKEEEIKNLRIIFISKLNSLSKDFSRERLRETYV